MYTMSSPKMITYEHNFEDMLVMGKKLLDDGYYYTSETLDHDWYKFIFEKDSIKYIFEYIRP